MKNGQELKIQDYLYKVLTIFKGRIVRVNGQWVVKEKERQMENLSGYKPEAPEENSNAAFGHKGPVVMFKSEKFAGPHISEADKEFNGEFSSTKVGDKIFQIGLQVPETATKNAKRIVFKKWNIDSDFKDAKGKTQAMKLADWLNPKSTGLTLTDEASLTAIIERLKNEPWEANLWVIKFDDKEIQMSRLEAAGLKF